MQGATEGGRYTAGAGTAQAVGTANASNATQGILGNIGNLAGNIDWSTIFKPKRVVGGGLPLHV